MTNDPDALRLLTMDLDKIEQHANGTAPHCAGCSHYWEDPDAGVRGFGFCRRHPPLRDADREEDRSPTTGFNWYCGEFKRGCHPSVVEQRKLWRADIKRRLKDAPK